jgi:hypothetical protein
MNIYVKSVREAQVDAMEMLEKEFAKSAKADLFQPEKQVIN